MLMSIKDKFKVQSVRAEIVKEWFLKKHYAERMPSITYCFQLLDENNLTIGVCSFGFPMASQLQDAVKGLFPVMELNRLVVNEGLPENTLSFFVSNCLKQLPKPICIVSYADSEFGHNGYIYQATNWIYTGTGAGGYGWAVKGLEHLHHTSIEDSVGRYENRSKDKSLEELLTEKYGDRLYKKKESEKHRYFFFIGDKKDKKIFAANFKYEIKPYPKGENKRYDAGYNPAIQTSLF